MPAPRMLKAEARRSAAVEDLARAVLGVADRAAVPGKLAVPAPAWAALMAALDDEDAPCEGHAPTLEALHRACWNRGAEPLFLAALAGARFPVAAAGVAWQRGLGPTDPARDAFDAALGRLRLERQGLELRRWVELGGQAVDWAIAGLLPTGQAVRVAIVVRGAEAPDEALLADLADDAIAAGGFAILAFRPWQLRWATACALAVAAQLEAGAPTLRLPRRLHDPQELPPVHPAQAAPVVATPRPRSPRWDVREAVRRAHPGLATAALVPAYREALEALTAASEEEPAGGYMSLGLPG